MSRRHQWLSEPLPGDVRTALARLERAPDVAYLAVMPVVAAKVLADLIECVPVVKHRVAEDLPPPLMETPLSHPGLERQKERTGRVQLGTLGRGNHFLELQSDDDGRLWVMIHSGSRGMGTLIRDHHEANAERAGGGLRRIAAESELGAAYLSDLAWALSYAELNRAKIRECVTAVLRNRIGAAPVAGTRIQCHHNLVRRETHFGDSLYVHRKGAISARAGELGIIPGSMGTHSFHAEGRGEPLSPCSSSHGAGRRLARGEARRLIRSADVARQLRGVFHDRSQTPRLADESPAAWKDIDAVMRARKDLLIVRRRLTPVLVHKGT